MNQYDFSKLKAIAEEQFEFRLESLRRSMDCAIRANDTAYANYIYTQIKIAGDGFDSWLRAWGIMNQ